MRGQAVVVGTLPQLQHTGHCIPPHQKSDAHAHLTTRRRLRSTLPAHFSLTIEVAKAQTVWKEISPGGSRPPGKSTAPCAVGAAAAATASPAGAVLPAAGAGGGAGSGVPSTLWRTSLGRTRPLGRLPRAQWLGGMCGRGSAGAPSSIPAPAAPSSDPDTSAFTAGCGIGSVAASAASTAAASAGSSLGCGAPAAAPSCHRLGGRRPGLRCVPGSGRTIDQCLSCTKKGHAKARFLKAVCTIRPAGGSGGRPGGGGGGGWAHRLNARGKGAARHPIHARCIPVRHRRRAHLPSTSHRRAKQSGRCASELPDAPKAVYSLEIRCRERRDACTAGNAGCPGSCRHAGLHLPLVWPHLPSRSSTNCHDFTVILSYRILWGKTGVHRWRGKSSGTSHEHCFLHAAQLSPRSPCRACPSCTPATGDAKDAH